MRAVRENIKPRSCCIDRAIARSVQQDRGLIFSRTARTVEVSKFFYYKFFIIYLRLQKKKQTQSRGAKVYKVHDIFKNLYL